jgi:hypothetical protein
MDFKKWKLEEFGRKAVLILDKYGDASSEVDSFEVVHELEVEACRIGLGKADWLTFQAAPELSEDR